MSDQPPTPETPKQRLVNEYEDPHYHDEDEVAPVEATEQQGHARPAPRRKPVYRPRRRFYEE
jgi:hypothetical protein